MPLAKVHDKNFEINIRDVVKHINKHLKEEYRKVTKKTLSLKEEGDIEILVQTANRRTCYVNAVQVYKLSDVEIDNGSDSKAKKVYDNEQEHFADIAKRWLMNTKG